jgi:hypothetical protein
VTTAGCAIGANVGSVGEEVVAGALRQHEQFSGGWAGVDSSFEHGSTTTQQPHDGEPSFAAAAPHNPRLQQQNGSDAASRRPMKRELKRSLVIKKFT